MSQCDPQRLAVAASPETAPHGLSSTSRQPFDTHHTQPLTYVSIPVPQSNWSHYHLSIIVYWSSSFHFNLKEFTGQTADDHWPIPKFNSSISMQEIEHFLDFSLHVGWKSKSLGSNGHPLLLQLTHSHYTSPGFLGQQARLDLVQEYTRYLSKLRVLPALHPMALQLSPNLHLIFPLRPYWKLHINI